MGFFDFLKTKDASPGNLNWTINMAGTWVSPGNNSDTYINTGYKQLPNVYSIISRILAKSTIVPAGFFEVKDEAKYQNYRARIKNLKSPGDYAKAMKYKSESLEKVENSDAEKLLLNPNNYQSYQQFNNEIDGYKLLTGNSIIYKLALSEGKLPKGLHAIPSPFVEMLVEGNAFDPEFSYKIGYLQNPIPGEDIIHMKYWNPVTGYSNQSNQYWGQSPLQAARTLLGRYMDADITQGFMFKNQGPGGLLSGESGDLTQEQAQMVQDRFKQQHTGTHKANDIIVTPSKMSWTSIGLSPVDLNIKEGKEEILSELCNIYKMPIALFTALNSTDNNMSHARRAEITDAVIPLVEARKEMYQSRLIDQYGLNLKIEYDYSIFSEMQEDFAVQAETLEKLDVLTLNEKRAYIGYDKMTDPLMEKVYLDAGKVPLDEVGMGTAQIDESALTGDENPKNS